MPPELFGVALPVLGDLDTQVEIHLGTQQLLDLSACGVPTSRRRVRSVVVAIYAQPGIAQLGDRQHRHPGGAGGVRRDERALAVGIDDRSGIFAEDPSALADPASSAYAAPEPLARAIPIPNATANPPARPTY